MSLVEQWKNEDLGAANTGGAMPRAALEAANDMDGQKALRLTRLAQDLGLPEGLVAENPQRAELDATARRIEKNPLFAEWASEDRLNAALARDDTEAMGGVFDRVSQVWTRESEALGQAWERGKGQLDIADLGNRILDSEEGYALLPEIEKAQKAANPLYEQESFGIVQPGTLSSTPHVVNVDGRGVLLPSLDENNAPLNREQALERFQQGGQHAGVFSSPQAAMLFLSQPVARQQELYAGFKQKTGESWVESALGPGTAVEQLPRMLFRQFPMAAESAAWGAAGGFATGVGSALVLGQAGPQAAIPEEIFTIPAAGIAGFGLGGKAAWSLGTAKSAYWAERGSFAIELAQMRDANGERLPVEVVRNASNIYGFLAAAEEGLFEYAFLSLLKPLGMSGAAEELGRQGTKTFLRSAIKRAAADRSVGMGLLDMGARLGLNSILEGMEEGVQETTAALVEYLALGYGNQFDGKNFVGNELFTAENATRIGEAFTGGAVAGFWLGSGPIVLSGAVDIQSAREAAAFADRHLSTYEKVEAANTKQLSPQHMQSALEAAGPAMRERVDLPADAALELYQGGIDVLSPLGITEQQAEAAAGQGQAFTVPVSRMHAFMDRQQFEAASQIMRRTPEAMSLAESARLDERVASDAQKIVELYQQQAEEFDLMTQEKERVRQWAREAVGSVPGLKAQAESLGGGVDAYVDDWLNVAERFAARMSTAGQSPVDTFRRFITRSLERGNQLSDSTVDDFYNSIFGEGSGTAAYEQGMEAEARGAANAESVLGKVRGRLDGRSLKRDYPDAYREIVRVHGPGIFRSAEKGGLPLDYLAAELVESNAFQEGMGADELLEYLKRPHSERRLFQPLNPGVDLDAPVSVVRVAPQFEGKNPKVLRKRFPAAIKKHVLGEFNSPEGVINRDTGKRVGMSAKDFKEHLKFDDADKVDGRLQLEAIAALPDLMRAAKLVESYGDTKETANIKSMHRFQAALRIGNEDYSVKLTVKEFKDGTLRVDTDVPVKLYHHRLEKRMPAGNSDTLPETPDVNRPSADIDEYTLRQLLEDVNDSEGRRYFQSAPPTESAAFKKWFGDSKVVDGNGKPLVLWHQTNADIAAFDPRKPGAGQFDNETPFGIFMKPADNDIGLGGIQMPLYAKIEKPFHVLDRADLARYLESRVEGYADLKRQYAEMGSTYEQRLDEAEARDDALLDVWEAENPKSTMEEREAAWDTTHVESDAVLAEWTNEGNRLSSSMKELVDAHFRDSAYDGIIIERDAGSMGRSVKTYIALDSTQIKSVNNRGTFDPNDPRILYQSAFHGSPHRFDKFSLEHIGSGEGAQAYGWGLYFAGDKAIAEWYREELTRPGRTLFRDLTMDGKRYRVSKDGEWTAPDGSPVPDGSDQLYALELVTQYGADEAAGRITLARETLEDIGEAAYAEEFGDEARSLASLDNIERLIRTIPAQEETGQLYEVDIPESSEMLDWDKPISQQSEKVRQSLLDISDEKSIADDIREQAQADFEENGPSFYPQDRFDTALEEAISEGDYGETFGTNVWEELAEAAPGLDWNAIRKQLYSGIEAHTGESVYKGLSEKFGSGRAASEHLNSLGIKGIRYLDATSRDAGEGSYNYVVFDDSAIEILNTYYQQRAEGARGSVTIRPEGYIIELFRGADLSTLFHESAHIFYEEISLFVREGLADESMIRDFEGLKGWFSRFDDDAALREEYERSVRGTPLFAGRGFGTLNEAEKAQAREIAEKEYFARGFEAYLLEGKAPSPELRSVFARFKEWLRKVYDAARDLNVELTDEVRGVFDRMIATEREIAAVAARNELLDLTRSELDALGITGPARQYARTLMGAARKAAAQKLEEDRNKDRKRRLAQYTKDAREELLELPVYAARAEIRKTPLDTAAVAELYGEEAARALRKTMPFGMKEGGVDPEILAAEQGFESGADMVAQVIESPSLGKAVQALVREKDARHDVEYGAAEYLLDTDQANEQVAMVGRYLAQSLGREHLQQEAFARVAEQELAAMPMGRAVQTGNFLAAMRRALRQERQAISRGDFAAALEANHKGRLNMEFARRSRDIAKTQDAIQRLMKRFIGMAKGDTNARFIVMDIGMRHGLSKFNERLGEGRDVRTIQKWMNEAEAGGYTLFADERILYGPGTPWREMPLADFEGLADTIKQIVTVERNQRQIATKQGKADLDEVAAGIAASIYAQRNSTAAKTVETQPAALKSLKGLHAIHMKVEAICIALDGDTRGPTWEAVYLPIAQADDAQSMRFREVRDALKSSDLFGRYTRKELAGMGGKKELVKEIGESLTWENRIALALNMGNETNVSRIRDGHNWSDEQIAAVLRPLTRRDWEFVQSVWDYIGSFKEESFALQEEISGMRPVSVEARPFTVQTADGAILNMRGGYYPIKYNSDKGFRAFTQEQKAMDKELFGGRNYGAAMTKTGHLKDRSEGGMGSPLLLELPVITDHIFNTVHDITHRKAVLDVAKVIKHKAVSQAIENTVGQEIYRELMPWLQDVANERQEPMHAVHRWARWARAGSSIMQMGYKVTTMLAQPLGFTQSVHLLGYKWAGKGLKLVYGNPLKMPELLEETFARSAFMANRIKSFDREVRDIAKQLKPGMGRFAWVDKVKENAFVPMGYFQMGVDLPTWWGAFAKGVEDFKGDEVRAAEYADSVVRMSQGSGSTKDLARVQRGGDLLRLTTMFYSYFNTLYNLGARGITALKNDHSPAGIFQAANTALLLWFIPAVLSEVFAGRGPDEDEEPGEWALMNILQYPFQAVVGVRDLTNAIFGEYGYQITPAQAAPKSLVNWFKAVNKAMEEEDAGKLVKPTAEAAGYLFGLPMKQPIITVGNLWDYITGEDPELHARDLFFVKPKSRR